MKKSKFERIIKKTFLSLEAKHGFKKTKTEYHNNGVTVSFQNPTTEVILLYEIGTFPWVTIADINNPKTNRTSLDWLLVELGERESPTTDEAFLPAKMDDSQLEVELKKKSDQLLHFGTDFLKGDFTLLPTLQQRAEDYLTECKKITARYKTTS